MVARPLLAALRPELNYLMQPLGGEYAGTRELLTSVPFAPGYGVEIGLLIDTYDRLGLDAIAQVNLGVREHRNRPLTELATMSRQVIATLLSRCGVPDSAIGLTQLASISERRIDRLMNAHESGLPAFLVRDSGLNSGLMMAHVTAAALVSEMKTLAPPASVDSIPTSAGREDHVSMSMGAAHKTWRAVELATAVVAIELLAACRIASNIEKLPTLLPRK